MGYIGRKTNTAVAGLQGRVNAIPSPTAEIGSDVRILMYITHPRVDGSAQVNSRMVRADFDSRYARRIRFFEETSRWLTPA